MRILTLLLFLFLCSFWEPTVILAAPPKNRSNSPTLHQKVERVLHYPYNLLKRSLLRLGKGPSLVQVLYQIARDKQQSFPLRSRAITSLSFFPTTLTQTLFPKLLQKPQPSFLQKKALEAMASVLPKAAIPAAIRLLHSADVHCREVAIGVLTRHPTPAGNKQLHLRLQQEKVTFLRRRLQLYLKKHPAPASRPSLPRPPTVRPVTPRPASPLKKNTLPR
jgi:hypothetical protein